MTCRLVAGLCYLLPVAALAQSGPPAAPALWHDQSRTLRYRPDGFDFVITNGNKRFARALYGTNTPFRVEAGDMPEFALYLPGMGGNFKLGLLVDGQSKWLIEADSIEARYRPGAMIYEVKDPLLGAGMLHLEVLAQTDAEGMLIRARFENVPANKVRLLWAFGGATGKKFSRDGDIGADPESNFYLKPEYCQGNVFELKNNTFRLTYGTAPKPPKSDDTPAKMPPGLSDKPDAPLPRPHLVGVMPPTSEMHIADAAQQASPAQLYASQASATPVLAGAIKAKAGETFYFAIQKPEAAALRYAELPQAWSRAEAARQKLANRVRVQTPDPYINTLGGALSIAADAIWQDPAYLHGSIAWRMPLNGWRGAYTADPLGWHDRAQTHFRSYAKSQLTSPAVGPLVMDTVLHLARHQEKLGTAVFSSGYISRNPGGDFRPHHYDMNLVYIDALLRHLRWTGDLAMARELWPVLQRHLAWEKRNFDTNNDGLYDAYAAIWASDALQYSGGAVTHSSAYNYLANKLAAELATRLGQNPEPYRQEAAKIHQALNARLWMPSQGWYAEYQDALGLKQLHPAAALWTVYHALDSEVPDAFQAYQALRYVDTNIPHIPVRATGLPDEGYHLLSTTNWQPYDWSINNVAMAEVLHTTLANWQAGRTEEAFKLWKSALLESMYLGSSPGNIQQVSFYDAHRGELYRDFADPIGVASRTLLEGLFGIVPDALGGILTIRPGLPAAWNNASLTVPDIDFDFKRRGQQDKYNITPRFAQPLRLRIQVQARAEAVQSVTVNGQAAKWQAVESAVGQPVIEISSAPAAKYEVAIIWQGAAPDTAAIAPVYAADSQLEVRFPHATITKVFDPQKALRNAAPNGSALTAQVTGLTGARTAFVQLRQGGLTWWAPLAFEVRETVKIIAEKAPQRNGLRFWVQNNTEDIAAKVIVGNGRKPYSTNVKIPRGATMEIAVPTAFVVPGSNVVTVEWSNGRVVDKVLTWAAPKPPQTRYETVNLAPHFNDQVTQIFQNEYLSPRPAGPTLQLPTQGIGNWCYPLTQAVIDDTGLRQLAGGKNEIVLPWGTPLRTPGTAGEKNILFVSQWDNYADQATVPLGGKSSHAYLLMAGSTNPMQSQLVNGEVLVTYADGTTDTLPLRNPDNWAPIEQDYFQDDFAFDTGAQKPFRLHLKTGLLTREFKDYTSIKGFSTRAIDGGAATVLDMPLNPKKKLRSLTLKALANDVVIGLMSVTLVRE
ncbi:DUF4450 domain-containing protein [Hymenobacter sp. BT188]|uniref:DUF4450 domain-containing protein n=1 Tax=Hymenobacter sp. BT188 TaxID=2763504 RepID=UPI0016511D42|nr:DUF4450 domain-containing protein [Hymenobacter sp. BT188]MBC6607617.1 DUF4450 domain-containing protein [Hymenobacter sp. BT188]